MEIFSFCASAVATLLGVAQAFGKKMNNVLIMNFLGNFLVGVSYITVSSFSGAAVCFTACVQVLVNYIFSVRGKRLPGILLLVYATAFLIVNFLVYTSWFDLLSLGATMVYVISMAQRDVKRYRILYAVNSFLWIAYDVMTQSYGNLWTHIILLVSTGIAIGLNERRTEYRMRRAK